jgi:uncharacterized membrane protein (UPF0127 family)
MKKIIIISLILGLIIILIITSMLFINKDIKKDFNKVIINNKEIFLEIADNDSLRETGLMNREKLDYDSGMLFIFDDEKILNFWMKNTLIPLDMIFIDKDLSIINIKHATPCKKDPCDIYASDSKAKYVLEVNYNYTNDNNIKIGDKVKLEIH